MAFSVPQAHDGPVTIHHLADDRQLAKRLAREARVSTQAQARAERVHAKAVARRERKRIKARQALPLQVVLAVGWGLLTVPAEGPWAVVAGVVAALQGTRAAGSVALLRRAPLPPLVALPPVRPVAPPPHPRSVAWPAVRRLEVVRHELSMLLPLVAPAGTDAAHEAWQAAGEADAALRWQAARLAAVEPHRGPSAELMQPLYDGVACQERLLVAVADLVAASADPLATGRLQDATDALHGIAMGLRELR